MGHGWRKVGKHWYRLGGRAGESRRRTQVPGLLVRGSFQRQPDAAGDLGAGRGLADPGLGAVVSAGAWPLVTGAPSTGGTLSEARMGGNAQILGICPVLSPGWGTPPPHGWKKHSGMKRLHVSSRRPDRRGVCLLRLALKIPTVSQTPKPGKRPAQGCPRAALPRPDYPVGSSEGAGGLGLSVSARRRCAKAPGPRTITSSELSKERPESWISYKIIGFKTNGTYVYVCLKRLY